MSSIVNHNLALLHVVVTFMQCLTVLPNTDFRGVICIVLQLLACAKFNRSLSCENVLSSGRKHVRICVRICPLQAQNQHKTDKKIQIA